MFLRKEVLLVHKDLQIIDYNPVAYRGVDRTDEKAIHLALQNGKKLTIIKYGHIHHSTGHWIADGMLREKNQ